MLRGLGLTAGKIPMAGMRRKVYQVGWSETRFSTRNKASFLLCITLISVALPAVQTTVIGLIAHHLGSVNGPTDLSDGNFIKNSSTYCLILGSTPCSSKYPEHELPLNSFTKYQEISS